jgi:hypothetical protein
MTLRCREILIHPTSTPDEQCTFEAGHPGPHSWRRACLIQSPVGTSGENKVRCVYELGHTGLHSWEPQFERMCMLCGGSIPVKGVVFKSGAASTKVPRLDLIPYEALCRLAERFELGLERHKEKSWNARQNQQALEDKEWVIARAVHTIHHALKYIEKMEGRLPDDGDDDAAAIMWAGACLIMAKKVQQK